jgi:hypothetical protein
MNPKHLKRIVVGFALGLSGFALAVTIPNYFVAGMPISSMSVNDNFSALKASVDAVETGKQARVTGSCTGGQAVQSVAADGTVTCGGGVRAWVTVSGSGTIYAQGTGVTWTVSRLAAGHYCVSTSPSVISTISPVVATLLNSGQPGMITFNNGWGDTCPAGYGVYTWNGAGAAFDSYFTLMVP